MPGVCKIIPKMETYNEKKVYFPESSIGFEALFSKNMKYEKILNNLSKVRAYERTCQKRP